jgi:hypothetical protein
VLAEPLLCPGGGSCTEKNKVQVDTMHVALYSVFSTDRMDFYVKHSMYISSFVSGKDFMLLAVL